MGCFINLFIRKVNLEKLVKSHSISLGDNSQPMRLLHRLMGVRLNPTLVAARSIAF
jgi:hypothetical protein